MTTTPPNPLRSLLEQAAASFMAYGPAGAGVEVVESFGPYEAEYAAVRQRVAVLHEPQRGVLRFTGADRKDFLHRLTTQDVNAMRGGDTRRAFQLNEKGRIVADVLIHHGDADTWLEADRFDLSGLKSLLESRLFSEDVTVEDISEARVALSLHGPATLPLLKAIGAEGAEAMFGTPGTHHVLRVRGAAVTAYRHDPCGVPGARLLAPAGEAPAVYAALLEAAGFSADAPAPEEDPAAAAGAAAARRQGLRGRPIGWLAFNTARIEGGSPIFHIDFGPDTLPHETGVLEKAVSFKKGCYLGQEIVARMQNLGHAKKVLVGLRCADDRMPIAGQQVFEGGTDAKPRAARPEGSSSAAPTGAVIGAITSSTVSPMLGATAIALAMMKWGKHRPGTSVLVPAEGALVSATVQGLKFV